MRTLLADARALALLALVAAPAAAQAPARTVSTAPAPAAAAPAPGGAVLPAGEVYRREVFRYQAGGRPDPFQPLLSAAELGFRVEDLRLTAIIYSPQGNRSVAVFAEGDSARRYRLHQGQRLGTMTVLRIFPNRVDVRVDEFGGSHLQSIPLERRERIEQQAAAAAGAVPAAAPPQIPVTITQPAPTPRAPRVLRRGPAPSTAPAAPPPAPPAPSINPRSPSYTSGTRPR
jgi:hypothetical protein